MEESKKTINSCEHVDENGKVCGKRPAHYSKRSEGFICKDHLVELMYKIMRKIPITIAATALGILALIFL